MTTSCEVVNHHVTQGRGPRPQARRLVLLLALALLAAIVYSPLAGGEFITFDDDAYVTANDRVKEGLTLRGAAWAFTAFEAANWHPLTWLSHMLDVELFGLRAGAHHAVSVVLHAGAAALLLVALEALTGALWPGFLAAALMVAHPQHVESVAWVAERKDVLSGFFWMLTLLLYVRYVRNPGAGRFAALTAAYALSLLAKPMGVSLPFVLLLLDYWPLGRWGVRRGVRRQGPSWQSVVAEKIPLLVLAGASSAITVMAQRSAGAVVTFEGIPLGMRVGNALTAVARYLGKTLWPAGLAPYYPHPEGALPAWQVAGAAALIVCVSALAVFLVRRAPFFAVGWFMFLGMLVPVLGVVQVGGQAMADRYMYLPHTGLFVLGVFGLSALTERFPQRGVIRTAAAVVVLGALALAARRQAGFWSDGVTLFERTIAVTGRNWMAEYQLGAALNKRGRVDEAIEHFERSVALKNGIESTQFDLGLALTEQGRLDEAKGRFRVALRLKPDSFDSWFNLGVVFAKEGDYAAARPCFERAVRLNPDNEQARDYLEQTIGLLEQSGDPAR